MKLNNLLFVCVLASCSTEAEGPKGELDIERLSVTESATKLEITGIDSIGLPVGHVTLEVGTFDVEDIGVTQGRRMKVEALGTEIEHTSAGFEPRELPLMASPKYHAVNELLADPRVAEVLARWDMTFKRTTPEDFERATWA